MSRLQETAKPLLGPILLGEASGLANADQRVLSAWATMFTMVAETTAPSNIVTTSAERAHLMEVGEAPPNWVVWMGQFEGTPSGELWHSSRTILKRGEPYDERTPRNTQVTSVAVGKALIQTFSTTSAGGIRIPLQYDAEAGLIRIWPTRRFELEFHPQLSRDAALAAFDLIRNYMDRVPTREWPYGRQGR